MLRQLSWLRLFCCQPEIAKDCAFLQWSVQRQDTMVCLSSITCYNHIILIVMSFLLLNFSNNLKSFSSLCCFLIITKRKIPRVSSESGFWKRSFLQHTSLPYHNLVEFKFIDLLVLFIITWKTDINAFFLQVSS